MLFDEIIHCSKSEGAQALHVFLAEIDIAFEDLVENGLDLLPVEVQVMAIGPLAIVTLPGEPMTELGMKIREQSPFPQTLVLGYSNGSGVFYVGMPGEKARGGYETGEKSSIGKDQAGQLLVEAAISLLTKVSSGK